MASGLLFSATFDPASRTLSLVDRAGNALCSFTVPSLEAYDDPQMPLVFLSVQSGSSVTLNKVGNVSGSHEISFNGDLWNDYVAGTTIPLNKGSYVYFRAKVKPTQNPTQYWKFSMSGGIKAYNNVNSMIQTDFLNVSSIGWCQLRNLFEGCTALLKAPLISSVPLDNSGSSTEYYRGQQYHSMFKGCSSLVTAPRLPITTIGERSFQSMFDGCSSLVNVPDLEVVNFVDTSGCMYMFANCTSLVNAPALPATSLTDSCYYGMFSGCTSLTNAPTLSATTLASGCYSSMFYNCTSLVNAPALPATSLANGCYSTMFYGCTSLVNAPALPATSLADRCYMSMFSVCTGLTKSPYLPATTLTNNCYNSMFYGCSNLSEVICLATSKGTDSLNGWLLNVSATGDFYCDPNSTIFPTSASGIPSEWTRHDIADYPT